MNGRLSGRAAWRMIGWHIKLTFLYGFFRIARIFLKYFSFFFILGIILIFIYPLYGAASLFFGMGCYEFIPGFNRGVHNVADEMEYFVAKSKQFCYIEKNRKVKPLFRKLFKDISKAVREKYG